MDGCTTICSSAWPAVVNAVDVLELCHQRALFVVVQPRDTAGFHRGGFHLYLLSSSLIAASFAFVGFLRDTFISPENDAYLIG
jgi:hypothetical protein